MSYVKKNRIFLRLLFSAVGIVSFCKIINDYGMSNVLEETSRSGVLFIFLIFSFVPTLVLYATSWLMLSEHKSLPANLSIFKKLLIFTKFTIIGIAWNNLTPFS